MTLVEQIAHLRQLAIDDPDTSLLDLTLINALAELANAVQELWERSPPRNSAGSSASRRTATEVGSSSPGDLGTCKGST
jgi:hypothetical protein